METGSAIARVKPASTRAMTTSGFMNALRCEEDQVFVAVLEDLLSFAVADLLSPLLSLLVDDLLSPPVELVAAESFLAASLYLSLR